MKLSELIDRAQRTLAEAGDMDVCLPAEGEGIDEGLTSANFTKVRQFGDPVIPMQAWDPADHRLVFVIG